MRTKLLLLILAVTLAVAVSSDAFAQRPTAAPKKYTVFPSGPTEFGYVNPPHDLTHIKPMRNFDMAPAASWDWRTMSGVTPVRNQNPYGTCWAFAALGDLESKVLIGESIVNDYSELNIQACNVTSNDCMAGGNAWMSTNYLSLLGSVDELCDPYPGGCPLPTCINPSCTYLKQVTEWKVIANDVTAIKAALMTYGPVYSSMYASFPGFSTYNGIGCLSWGGTEATNHGVLIVGWNDDLCGAGVGGWIVKNSWGTAWGDNGYFYIEYGSAQIGTNANVITGYKDHDPNKTTYYLDEWGWWSALGYSDTHDYAVVELTPQNPDEYLFSLHFWATSSPTTYSVSLYDDFDGSTMPTTLLAGPFTGTVNEAGYYTIDLPVPLAVSAGDPVFVYADLSTPGYNYPIPYDDSGPMETNKSFISSNSSSFIPIDAGGGSNIFGDIGLRATIGPLTTQTIMIDGVNDFLLANLVEAEGGDTEHPELDLDSIFVTNDANKLYFGIGFDKGSWTGNQIGIAISTGQPGGTTDAWDHAIAWTSAPHKPDFYAYCNMDNSWQELRNWDDGLSTWDPPIHAGTGSLGWVNGTGFEELGLNLSDLGLAIGDTIFYEIISTQDGTTKGPLDLLVGDDDQLSTPGGTTWDVYSPVGLDAMSLYIIEFFLDNEPPTLETFRTYEAPTSIDVDFKTDKLDARFNEPVDEITAETVGNYALSGGTVSIVSVEWNALFPDMVTITLDDFITPSDDVFEITVTNVEDQAGNPIVDNGETNVGAFFYKGVMWKGLMGLHMKQHSVAPAVDTFTVEGSLNPLTFGLCDNMFLTDDSDSIYVGYAAFSLLGEREASTWVIQDTTLEWKFAHQCAEYEPLAANRTHILSNQNGAWDTLEYWWNDEDAGSFTAGPIDVIFTVDANTYGATLDSVMSINGSALPLSFDIPSLNDMADDGVYPDAAAADGIYSLKVRFPALSPKTVGYKYVYNDVYECLLESNREVWLNDAAFDTIGGAMGPIVMPLQYYDRCGTIGRAVEVVFEVNTRWVKPGPTDTIAVNGDENNQLPLVMSWAIPSINRMVDDGTGWDDTADDGIYATSIVFPDSSNKFVEYKYLYNSVYECTTQANRGLHIDDSFDDLGNPQILGLAYFNTCWTDVTEEIPVIPFALKQNFPNPFNPVTTITFSVPERGRAVLDVYNVKGELVQTLIDEVVSSGEVSVTWDATDRYGRQISSGVYFYRLRVGDIEMSRKMILLR